MADIDLPTFLPSAGVLGLLVWLVIHMMRQSSGDRGDYQAQLNNLRKQHTVDLKEMSARHDAQITGLRSEIGILRAEVSDLRAQVEDERKARWVAEDAAARFRRMIDADVVEGGPDEPHAT